jgi:ADP-heptose:LPS heptosyltransferase
VKGICYFSNGLGNFIMQMPAMQAVASMTDSGKVDICLNDRWHDSRRPAVEDICRAWPVVDKIISWPKEDFNERDYDLWFYSAHGSGCDVVGRFLNNMKHRAVPKPAWRSSLVHETDHYMDIAYAMGYRGPVPQVEFPLSAEPVLDLPRPIIGICNGWFRTEKMYWQKKGWPHFEKLSAVLRSYFGGSTVVIGGKNEVSAHVKVDANFGGELPILGSAKVVSQLDLLITTDTGPMHLANAVGIPMIALFGPTLVSKNGPRGKSSEIIISRESCAPCQDKPAFYGCKKFACMESITVADVMVAARRKLR